MQQVAVVVVEGSQTVSVRFYDGTTVTGRIGQTQPDRDLATVVSAFHERLALSLVTARTDPPRMDRHDLRDRLGAQAGVGLRARLDRPLRTA